MPKESGTCPQQFSIDWGFHGSVFAVDMAVPVRLQIDGVNWRQCVNGIYMQNGIYHIYIYIYADMEIRFARAGS